MNLAHAVDVAGCEPVPGERVGPRPAFRVGNLNGNGGVQARIELVRQPSAVVYGPREGAMARYEHAPTASHPLARTIDGAGAVLDDLLQLAITAGERYTLRATDHLGNVVDSATSLETWRRVYVQPVVMTSARPQYDTFVGRVAEVRAAFAGHFVDLVFLAKKDITDIDMIATPEQRDALQQSITNACAGAALDALAPHIITLAFVMSLGEVREASMSVPIDADIAYPATFAISQCNSAHATHFVPTESWLMTFPKFFPARSSDPTLDFDGKVVTRRAPNLLFPHRWSQFIVSLDVDRVRPPKADTAAPTKEQMTASLRSGGTLKFRFRHLYSVGGLSANGPRDGRSKLLLVCTRVNDQQRLAKVIVQNVIHELGHKLGLVPTGTETSLCDLDATPTSYEAKGHQGPHCHQGLARLDSYAGLSGARCVMFGEDCASSDFCPACGEALKKMDLSAGWTT